MNTEAGRIVVVLAYVALVLGIVFAGHARGAHEQRCMPAPLAIALIEIEGVRIGAEPIHLDDAGEVARYLAVINEKPPVSGQGDRLVLLTNAELGVTGVWLIDGDLSCESYLVASQLHARALKAARGEGA